VKNIIFFQKCNNNLKWLKTNIFEIYRVFWNNEDLALNGSPRVLLYTSALDGLVDNSHNNNITITRTNGIDYEDNIMKYGWIRVINIIKIIICIITILTDSKLIMFKRSIFPSTTYRFFFFADSFSSTRWTKSLRRSDGSFIITTDRHYI